MSDKGHVDAQVLHWSGKLFSADDLRRHWKNQRELVLLPRALLTPLAQDELRARGIRVTRQETNRNGEQQQTSTSACNRWACVQEKPSAIVAAAVAALEREGKAFTAFHLAGKWPAAWLQSIDAWRRHAGSVVFCADAALVCGLANKVAGLRAAALDSARQAGRALASMGANVLVVEMPGRTYFEVRQILNAAYSGGKPECSPEIAKVFLELEGHAHR